MNVYEVVNNRILDLLEAGTVPWRKPWNAQSGYPKNLVSNKEYKGVNVFLLACQEYSSPYWVTFKQCVDRGGIIKQGEKGSPVIFWKWLDNPESDNPKDRIPMLRFYKVFNSEQCEGIATPVLPVTTTLFTPVEKAELIFLGMPNSPEIKHGGNRAYYSPNLDYIQLPNQQTFSSAEEYHNTVFHECVHATGHSKRLARKSILEPSYFGSHEYSKEELVAEMGAAFLCGHCDIVNTTIENSAAYIKGWLRALKNDKTLLVHAAAQAQKAADYILNKQPEAAVIN